MKNILFILSLAVGMLTCHAVNVDVLDGAIALKDVKVERSQSRLILHMDIDASALKLRNGAHTRT